MKLHFKYSPKYDIYRVKSTIKKMDFYEKNKYIPILPDSINKNSDDKTIEFKVKKDWNKSAYMDTIDNINSEWSKISIKLIENIKETGLKLHKSYDVFLTKYGVGGSYNTPNIIVLNIFKSNGQKKNGRELVKTIAHEIIHLTIDVFIIKNNIKHWDKEAIVSKFLSKLLPEIEQEIFIQNKNDELINKIFQEKYPDIQKIIKEVETIDK